MLIMLSDSERELLRNATAETEFSDNEMFRILEAAYSANLNEDIKSAIEHLQELEDDK